MSVYANLKRFIPTSIKNYAKQRLSHWQAAMQQRQTPMMRAAWEQVAFERKLARVVAEATPLFEQIQPKTQLKLNLGAGAEIKQGWVNVDLFEKDYLHRLKNQASAVCIPYDLRLRLPLPDGSCELIYSSHFLEHLDYVDGVQLIRNCYDLLQEGGVLRISIPDFRRIFEAYVAGDEAYFALLDRGQYLPQVAPETFSLIDMMNYTAYQHGEHKCMYDAEKLHKLFAQIGFSQSEVTNFKPEYDPDNEVRKHFSLYMEATK